MSAQPAAPAAQGGDASNGCYGAVGDAPALSRLPSMHFGLEHGSWGGLGAEPAAQAFQAPSLGQTCTGWPARCPRLRCQWLLHHRVAPGQVPWGRASATALAGARRTRRESKIQFPCEYSEDRWMNIGRISKTQRPPGLTRCGYLVKRPPPEGLRIWCWVYISIVFLMRPTANPSISKASPGCTVMTG
ncbi:hypothetical protein CLU88_0971 [Acidovorax sp. 56]|nr:hypothetical protein CLU88_0971 [Acidovorax sp. 56]